MLHSYAGHSMEHSLQLQQWNWPESPRLLRLSFVRPPPTSVAVGEPFDVIVAITDDLGDSAFAWRSVARKVQASVTYVKILTELIVVVFSAECSDSALRVLANGRESAILKEQQGTQHRISLLVQPLSKRARLSRPAKLSLRVDATALDQPAYDPSPKLDALLRFLGEKRGAASLSDEGSYIMMSIETAPISVENTPAAKKGALPRAVALPARCSLTSSAVQSFIRHLGNSRSKIDIIESPHAAGGLGIGGGHLWDAAIVLAFLLPAILATRSPSRPLKVVELGAGCGLVALAAARLNCVTSVVATDLSETVEGSLADNLARCPEGVAKVRSACLSWGTDSRNDALAVAATRSDEDLLLVASDVLYNPSSHDALLDTVEPMLRAKPTGAEMLLAYRPRTEGDDAFFKIARGKGLSTSVVVQVGVVSIWSLQFTSNAEMQT